jgi:hypothetical protein
MKVCLNLPGPIPPVLSMSTCKLEIGLRKVKICRFGSACNGFDATFFTQFAEPDKMHRKY